MICDFIEQFDIRKLVKLGCQLPAVFDFEGVSFRTTWTATNFGGHRQWFICPACECRCAIIYRLSESLKLGCRICLNGRYACEHKSPMGRKLQGAFAVRRRLGQKQIGIGADFPPKPKGKHWRTYEAIRIAAVHEELSIWLQGFADISGTSFEMAKQHFSKHL